MLVLQPCKGTRKGVLKINRISAQKTLQAVSVDKVWGMVTRTDQAGNHLFISMVDLDRGLVKMKLYHQEP